MRVSTLFPRFLQIRVFWLAAWKRRPMLLFLASMKPSWCPQENLDPWKINMLNCWTPKNEGGWFRWCSFSFWGDFFRFQFLNFPGCRGMPLLSISENFIGLSKGCWMDDIRGQNSFVCAFLWAQRPAPFGRWWHNICILSHILHIPWPKYI